MIRKYAESWERTCRQSSPSPCLSLLQIRGRGRGRGTPRGDDGRHIVGRDDGADLPAGDGGVLAASPAGRKVLLKGGYKTTVVPDERDEPGLPHFPDKQMLRPLRRHRSPQLMGCGEGIAGHPWRAGGGGGEHPPPAGTPSAPRSAAAGPGGRWPPWGQRVSSGPIRQGRRSPDVPCPLLDRACSGAEKLTEEIKSGTSRGAGIAESRGESERAWGVEKSGEQAMRPVCLGSLSVLPFWPPFC